MVDPEIHDASIEYKTTPYEIFRNNPSGTILAPKGAIVTVEMVFLTPRAPSFIKS
jgi:hypothetical protein